MIDYYEQLTQEEKEEVTEVIQTLYRQTFLLERKFDKRAGRSIQKNTVPVRSIWNFLKHILRWRGSYCGKMYIWV